MIPAARRRWWLCLVAAVALFTLLGSRGLSEPDEGRYAEIGREMAASGEWLVPHLNGFEHFQKPPLLYWLTAASIRVLGANEWAARLPSALAALGTVLLTAVLGQALFGESEGLLAGLILLSNVGFFVMGRLLTPDMLLTFWIVAALAAFLKHQRSAGAPLAGYLFFVCLGCGFLTKGPMALIVPLTAVAGWRAGQRGLGGPRLPWAGGLLLTLSISLSWFVALSWWRHDLFVYFWKYELVERFASSSHGRSKPWWFFLPSIFIAGLPWIFLLPALGVRTWHRLRERNLSQRGWFLLGWTIPPFVILSLSGSKLPTYILPLLPALALATAAWVVRNNRSVTWATSLAGGTLLVWLAAAAVFPHFNNRMGPQATLRELVQPLAHDPAGAPAKVFAIDVRAHGLEFYLRRPVAVTREQADIVLPPNPEQAGRLTSTEKFRAASLEPGAGQPSVLVLTRRTVASKEFPPARWHWVGQAGDFVLLRSTEEATAPDPNPR